MDISSVAVDQVREPCERHNVDVAALKENKGGIDVTPEFLANLTLNKCSAMKLMGRHPELYNLSLGTRENVVGQPKHCFGGMIANMNLGARAMYSHTLAKPAKAAGESCHADVAARSVLWESDGLDTILLILMSTHDTCMSFQCTKRVRQPHCLHICSSAFLYKYFDQSMQVYRGCILTREVSPSRATSNTVAR